MNKKQMKKLAQEIYECELIHQNPESSSEQKAQAERKIMELTNKICSSRNGLEIMSNIDELIQDLANKNN